jgi:glycosyltransferase involved in cell wall biosynthesis
VTKVGTSLARSEAHGRNDVTVSVIIPAFGTAEYISETLSSVFAQTFKDYEVIVINDGSPDSEELERLLAPFMERIVYSNQENRGLAGARNTGIRISRGKFLAFLDSDDCWLPEYLAHQMELFNQTPALDIVYSDALFFGDPALAGKTFMQKYPSIGPVTMEGLIKEDCQVIVSCALVRRQAVVSAGLFDESLRSCEDYDLWLRILHRGGRMAYQNKVLGRYRTRPNSLSQNRIKMSESLVAVYEKAERTFVMDDKIRAILKRQLARAQAYLDLEYGKNFLSVGDFGKAKDALTRANAFFRCAKLKAAILGVRFAPQWTRRVIAHLAQEDSRSRVFDRVEHFFVSRLTKLTIPN